MHNSNLVMQFVTGNRNVADDWKVRFDESPDQHSASTKNQHRSKAIDESSTSRDDRGETRPALDAATENPGKALYRKNKRQETSEY
jgi:hypothetical protein